MVLEYCKAPWTTNGRWRYINAYLFIYLFILMRVVSTLPNEWRSTIREKVSTLDRILLLMIRFKCQ